VARLNTYDKVKRRLRALRLEGSGLEGLGQPGDVLTREGDELGALTTVAGQYALAYVDSEQAETGTTFDQGEIVATPF